MTPKTNQPHDEDSSESPIVIGRFAGHFGVKGWLKIRSFTRPTDEILSYSDWWVKLKPGTTSQWSRFKIAHSTAQPKRIVAKLQGIDSREQAEELIGLDIAIFDSQLVPLNQGEYYWRQLLGLTVSNLDGDILGVIDEIVETGANDVLVVKSLVTKERLVNTDGAGVNAICDIDNIPSGNTTNDHPAHKHNDHVEDGGETRLIPWVDQVVIKVDLDQSTLLVDWDMDF